MSKEEKQRKKKEKRRKTVGLLRQIWKKSGGLLVILLALVIPGVVECFKPFGLVNLLKGWPMSIYKLLCMIIALFLVISVCNGLTKYFSLMKKEEGITWSQIAIIIAMGLFIIAFLIVFDIKKDSPYFVALGIIGVVLGWIFQDTIKGVAAFIHLRWNKLLNIGDWIQVPNLPDFDSPKLLII